MKHPLGFTKNNDTPYIPFSKIPIGCKLHIRIYDWNNPKVKEPTGAIRTLYLIWLVKAIGDIQSIGVKSGDRFWIEIPQKSLEVAWSAIVHKPSLPDLNVLNVNIDMCLFRKKQRNLIIEHIHHVKESNKDAP